MALINKDLSDLKLSEARANFEEQKKLLETKNQSLVELQLELASLESLIRELNVNPTELDAQISKQLEKERIMLAEEKRKASMLKEINISQNRLGINGSEPLVKSKLDNLIKCVLQAGSNGLENFSLVNSDESHVNPNDDFLKQVDRIKKLLLVSNEDSVELTQGLIDKICSKINEEKLCPKEIDSSQYVLLNDDRAFDISSDADKMLIIYEEEGNFLILKRRNVEEANDDVFVTATALINSLMSSELLDVMCRVKFVEKGVKSFGEDSDLNVMFKALKQIRADLEKKAGDDEAKVFLKYIRKIKVRRFFSYLL